MILKEVANSITQPPEVPYTQFSVVELAQQIGEYADNPSKPQHPVNEVTVICSIFRRYLQPMTPGYLKTDQCSLCRLKICFPVMTQCGYLYDRSCLMKFFKTNLKCLCLNEDCSVRLWVEIPDIGLPEIMYAQYVQDYRQENPNSSSNQKLTKEAQHYLNTRSNRDTPKHQKIDNSEEVGQGRKEIEAFLRKKAFDSRKRIKAIEDAFPQLKGRFLKDEIQAD